MSSSSVVASSRTDTSDILYNLALCIGSVVTAAEDALSERSVAARNEFRHALRVTALHLPPEAADHFHVRYTLYLT